MSEASDRDQVNVTASGDAASIAETESCAVSQHFETESNNFGVESKRNRLTAAAEFLWFSGYRGLLGFLGCAGKLFQRGIVWIPRRDRYPILASFALIVSLLITLQIVLIHSMVPQIATVNLKLLTQKIAALPSLQTNNPRALKRNMQRASLALEASLKSVAASKHLILIQKQAVVLGKESGVKDVTFDVAKTMLERLRLQNSEKDT